jgi:hypothetical protein
MTDTTTLPRATVQQALEALEKIADWHGAYGPFPENNEVWRGMAVVTARESVNALKVALEQPEQEQEPVDAEAALRLALAQRDWAFKQLQAQPDRREWRSLSEEEIDAIQWHGSPFQFARAVEAALRSKNQ